MPFIERRVLVLETGESTLRKVEAMLQRKNKEHDAQQRGKEKL